MLFSLAFLALMLSNRPSTPAAQGPPEVQTRGHLEVLEDPPAHQPVGPRAVSPRAIVTRGPYTSVQVNVDADGNNILLDAGNEPSIAVDPTNHNRMALGWRQFDTITSNFRQAGVAFTTDGGQSWVNSGVLDPGVFRSEPVLASDRFGSFCYSSWTSSGNLNDFFKSNNGGMTWSAPIPAYGGDKPWFTIDNTGGVGDGHIYSAWSPYVGCCGSNNFSRSTDGAMTWMPPIEIPGGPFGGTLAVGPDGELYVASVSGTGAAFSRSDNARFDDQVPTFTQTQPVDLGGFFGGPGGPNPQGLLGQAWVAVDQSTGPNRADVYLLCSVRLPGNQWGRDPLEVMFARSDDQGATWSAPLRINDDPQTSNAWQWFGTLAAAPNGRLDAVWNDTRSDPEGNFSELYYAFSYDGGRSWSANVPVSPPFNHFVGYPNQQQNLGHYYDMKSDDLGADVAYAATFNNEQDVYYLRIPADCNQNGVPDPQEVDGGSSLDCDGNLIPDECDRDCNANGIPDACDIASGTSLDCAGNGVPDDCEPDCNGNNIADSCDILSGLSEDCNDNRIPDECDLLQPLADCDKDGILDHCETFVAPDCNSNGIFDWCEGLTDTDFDGIPDDCDPDDDGDAVPDTDDNCPLTYNPGQGDCDGDGVGDACEEGPFTDCNNNGAPDDCEIEFGLAEDCNANAIPDECELVPGGTGRDCNDNGTLDECDIANGSSLDDNADGLPDECCFCGDFNFDNRVTLVDFVTFSVCFGHTAPNNECPEFTCVDLNADGVINGTDFGTFATIFGLAPDGVTPPNCLSLE